MDAKNIIKSWTFWANVLAAVGMFIQNADPNWKLLTNEQSGMALAVINVVLRFKTTQPVTVLPSK